MVRSPSRLHAHAFIALHCSLVKVHCVPFVVVYICFTFHRVAFRPSWASSVRELYAQTLGGFGQVRQLCERVLALVFCIPQGCARLHLRHTGEVSLPVALAPIIKPLALDASLSPRIGIGLALFRTSIVGDHVSLLAPWRVVGWVSPRLPSLHRTLHTRREWIPCRYAGRRRR